MKIVPALAILISSSVCGQIAPPTEFDFGDWGSEYVPEYRAYEPRTDDSIDALEEIHSPRLTRSIRIISLSNLVEVPYDQSIAKAVIFEGEQPLTTITINQYRNFEFEWLNENLIHLTNSPGRCVTIDTIYDVSVAELIYKAGFNHCGV